MSQRRTINVDKKCFDTLKNYCDDSGLKIPHFVSSVIRNEISRQKLHIDPMDIKSDDAGVCVKLFELFYKILNIQSNLPVWTNDIVKYGNSYVKLNITPDAGIVSIVNFKHLNRFEKGKDIEFRCGSSTFYNYEVLHFRHLADMDFLPYGVAIEIRDRMFSPSEEVRNNRKIGRLCRIIENELTKAAIIHLYSLGYRSNELVNFTLKIDEDFLKTIIQRNCDDIKNECKK